MICKKVLITGSVQGVFFRASAQEEAINLGVTGWIKNLSNGDVEAILCGTEKSVEQLEQWLHHGPDEAEVTKVDSSLVDLQIYDGFLII